MLIFVSLPVKWSIMAYKHVLSNNKFEDLWNIILKDICNLQESLRTLTKDSISKQNNSCYKKMNAQPSENVLQH